MAGGVAAPTELGEKKIGSLLKMYAVPGIIAQTAASLYNIIDSAYIGHIPGVGADAISGLAITFPLMNLSSALGMLVGVGAMTLVSVLLGQRNYEQTRKVLSNVLTLNIIIGLSFTLLTLPFLDEILHFFGASPSTLPFAKDYMTIILLGNVFTHLYFGFNGLIRTAGHPKTAMGLTLFTVISNAILDPIFIFALGLGIKGAALATVLCQIMALVYVLRFFSDRSKVLHFSRPLFRIDWKIARQSLIIGLGPFLMNSAACLVTMFINQQLGKYGGDLAIGAYGIINRVTMVFFMICMGFNQGLQPIAGYNFGAKQYHRVKEIFILTVKWELLVTLLCFLVSELLPTQAVKIFTSDPELIRVAVRGMRQLNAGVALVGFGIVTANLFQSLGMVKTSIFLSLSRQILFLIPLIYLLPMFLREEGVWLSFPIADTISVIFAAIFAVRLFRKLDRLKDGESAASLGGNIE